MSEEYVVSRGEDEDVPQMERIEIPPLRTFIVHRQHALSTPHYVPRADDVDVYVTAHGYEIGGSGAVAFSTYVLETVHGHIGPVLYRRWAFKAWDSIEEVVTVKPASGSH